MASTFSGMAQARQRSALGWMAALAAACTTFGCGSDEASGTANNDDDDAATSGSGGGGGTAVVNPDGDCLSDEEEAMLGTDPTLVDTDADGIGDCEEVACVSDPVDGAEKCYACGWKHNDPGNLVATGATEGDVVANMSFTDQCSEAVSLWDFAQEYHILFMTAAW